MTTDSNVVGLVVQSFIEELNASGIDNVIVENLKKAILDEEDISEETLRNAIFHGELND